MITETGYSSDSSIRPEGIVVTFGAEMMEMKGGAKAFIRYFLKWMADEESLWLHKCKNRPKHDDLLYVYVIVGGYVRYRLYYGGYEAGGADISGPNGTESISWSRVVMSGPVERAPYKIKFSGFQGFRYCTKLF